MSHEAIEMSRDDVQGHFRTIDDHVVFFADSSPNANSATRAAYHRQQAEHHRFVASHMAESGDHEKAFAAKATAKAHDEAADLHEKNGDLLKGKVTPKLASEKAAVTPKPSTAAAVEQGKGASKLATAEADPKLRRVSQMKPPTAEEIAKVQKDRSAWEAAGSPEFGTKEHADFTAKQNANDPKHTATLPGMKSAEIAAPDWQDVKQRPGETRGDYVKRRDNAAPKAKNIGGVTATDVAEMRDRIRAVHPGAHVTHYKPFGGRVMIQPGRREPFTPEQQNAISHVLREHGYVEPRIGRHFLPVDSHAFSISAAKDSDGPHPMFANEPKVEKRPAWDTSFAKFAQTHPLASQVEAARGSIGTANNSVELAGRMKNDHINQIRAAISSGKKPSDSVLNEYPLLKTVVSPSPSIQSAVAEAKGAKQPHEMIGPEYADSQMKGYGENAPLGVQQFHQNQHKALVRSAISEGKTVPEHVLADYPDLKERFSATNEAKGAGKTSAQPAAKEAKAGAASPVSAGKGGEKSKASNSNSFAKAKDLAARLDPKAAAAQGFGDSPISDHLNQLLDKGKVEVGYRSQAGSTHSSMKVAREWDKVVKQLKKDGVDVKEENVKHKNGWATNNGGFWNSKIYSIEKSSPLALSASRESRPVHSPTVARAHAAIKSGEVDHGDWKAPPDSERTPDGSLGPHGSYPVFKNGKLSKHALIAAESRATQFGRPDIAAKARHLLQAIKARGPAITASREDGTYECASTQIQLPDKIAAAVKAFSAAIPDADLGEDGREDDPHITVLYGLKTDDPAAVQKALWSIGRSVYMKCGIGIGTIGVFPATADRQSDVLYLKVESTGLPNINGRLSKLPHLQTHPGYTPHSTVAYVKAGLGKAYEGASVPGATGAEFAADTVVLSCRDKSRVSIPLYPPNSGGDKYQQAIRMNREKNNTKNGGIANSNREGLAASRDGLTLYEFPEIEGEFGLEMGRKLPSERNGLHASYRWKHMMKPGPIVDGNGTKQFVSMARIQKIHDDTKKLMAKGYEPYLPPGSHFKDRPAEAKAKSVGYVVDLKVEPDGLYGLHQFLGMTEDEVKLLVGRQKSSIKTITGYEDVDGQTYPEVVDHNAIIPDPVWNDLKTWEMVEPDQVDKYEPALAAARDVPVKVVTYSADPDDNGTIQGTPAHVPEQDQGNKMQEANQEHLDDVRDMMNDDEPDSGKVVNDDNVVDCLHNHAKKKHGMVKELMKGKKDAEDKAASADDKAMKMSRELETLAPKVPSSEALHYVREMLQMSREKAESVGMTPALSNAIVARAVGNTDLGTLAMSREATVEDSRTMSGMKDAIDIFKLFAAHPIVAPGFDKNKSIEASRERNNPATVEPGTKNTDVDPGRMARYRSLMNIEVAGK